MKSKTQSMLALMNVLAWISFIGLMVESGAILFSFIVSIINPEGSRNLYNGLNLYDVRQLSYWHYAGIVSFKIVIAGLQAYVAFLLTKVLSRFRLAHPFTNEVSQLLERISYYVGAIWILAMLHNIQRSWLAHRLPGLQETNIPGEFIFFAGIVFILVQVFKRGVEIQTENDLTV